MGNEKGFSLLEVLTGVMIFAFGMLGVAALLVATVRDNSFSGSMSEANLLMASKIDHLLSKSVSFSIVDFDDTDGDGLGGLDDVGADADHSDIGQGQNEKFDVYWNVANDLPVTNNKSIGVVVVWTDRDSPKQVSCRVIMTGES